MSDVAIVLSVGIVSAAGVAIVWLRHRAALVVLASQRDERERGIFPRVEACDAEVKKLRGEMNTFMVNNRR